MSTGNLISVVIPHMPGFKETDAAFVRCVKSLRGHDELIVVVNDGWGFARAVNLGLRLARGDYLIIANNDTELRRGSLSDLCQENVVTLPKMTPLHRDERPRAFYCMPWAIYDKVGEYDEQFERGYFEDDDLIRRFMAIGIEIRVIPTVEVHHLHGGGNTMVHVGPNEAMTENRDRFIRKWGEDKLFP